MATLGSGRSASIRPVNFLVNAHGRGPQRGMKIRGACVVPLHVLLTPNNLQALIFEGSKHMTLARSRMRRPHSTVNRPNGVGDPYSITRTVVQDFNTAAFFNNAQYTLGRAGRNILRQCSFFDWDCSSGSSGSTSPIRLASAFPERLLALRRLDRSPARTHLATHLATNNSGSNWFGNRT